MSFARRLVGTALVAALVLAGPGLGRAQDGDPLVALTAVLAQIDDPQAQLDILKGMKEGLKGRRSVPMPAGWETVAAKLARGGNAEVRSLARSLSVTFGSRSALEDLRRQMMDAKAATKDRAAALDGLLGAKDPELPASLRQLLPDAALRDAALRGLAAYDDPEAPSAILEAYSRLGAAEKRDALNTLVSRASYAGALMDSLEKGVLPKKDLSADIARQIRNLKSESLSARLEKVWGKSRQSPADKLQEIARYKALVLSGSISSVSAGKLRRPADRSLGRGVFSRVCQQCHTLFGVGGKVGPDITGSNRADLDYLLENIVDPNAVIPNDYRTWTVETKDDRVITGVMKFQDEKLVTLATPAEPVTIPRSEIRSIEQSDYSMMPEGLLTALGDDEKRDLISYLRGPAQVPLPP
jgi:putative heme-binding domain-containing protein